MTGGKRATLPLQRPAAASRRLSRRHAAGHSTGAGGLEGGTAALPTTDDGVPAASSSAPPVAAGTVTPALAAPDMAGSRSGSSTASASSDGSGRRSGASSRQAPATAASRGQRRQPPRLRLQAFLEIDDGPPRVVSLLDPAPGLDPARPAPSSRQQLPLLFYLPGIDGSGLAASRQFPSLLRRFDMQALVTPPQASRVEGG